MIGIPEVKPGVESQVELPFEEVKVTLLDKRGDPLQDGSLIVWRFIFEVEAKGVERLLVRKAVFLHRVTTPPRVLLELDYSVVDKVVLNDNEFWVGKDGRLVAAEPQEVVVRVTSFVRAE